jgi:hypothetical protein
MLGIGKEKQETKPKPKYNTGEFNTNCELNGMRHTFALHFDGGVCGRCWEVICLSCGNVYNVPFFEQKEVTLRDRVDIIVNKEFIESKVNVYMDTSLPTRNYQIKIINNGSKVVEIYDK